MWVSESGHSWTWLGRDRAQVVSGGLQRTVELFENMTRLEPSPEHTASLTRWMGRQREHQIAR